MKNFKIPSSDDLSYASYFVKLLIIFVKSLDIFHRSVASYIVLIVLTLWEKNNFTLLNTRRSKHEMIYLVYFGTSEFDGEMVTIF